LAILLIPISPLLLSRVPTYRSCSVSWTLIFISRYPGVELQRTDAFKAHAREQEEADIYKLAEESTAELEVIQNNATRWNSTYMMIERALIKQSELNSFIQELGLEADASRRVPTADILTSDDWKVLREVSHILEPIYNMTMRTQGWGTSGGHGRLWDKLRNRSTNRFDRFD